MNTNTNMNMNPNPYVLLAELDKERCAFCGDHTHRVRECEDAQKETNRLYNASIYHRNYALRNQDEVYLLKWFASLKIVELQLLFLKINPNSNTNTKETSVIKMYYSPKMNQKLRENKIQQCMDFFYYKYPEDINY